MKKDKPFHQPYLINWPTFGPE